MLCRPSCPPISHPPLPRSDTWDHLQSISLPSRSLSQVCFEGKPTYGPCGCPRQEGVSESEQEKERLAGSCRWALRVNRPQEEVATHSLPCCLVHQEARLRKAWQSARPRTHCFNVAVNYTLLRSDKGRQCQRRQEKRLQTELSQANPEPARH